MRTKCDCQRSASIKLTALNSRKAKMDVGSRCEARGVRCRYELHTVIHTIKLTGELVRPVEVDVAPDGRWAYVTTGSRNRDDIIAQVARRSRRTTLASDIGEFLDVAEMRGWIIRGRNNGPVIAAPASCCGRE